MCLLSGYIYFFTNRLIYVSTARWRMRLVFVDPVFRFDLPVQQVKEAICSCGSHAVVPVDLKYPEFRCPAFFLLHRRQGRQLVVVNMAGRAVELLFSARGCGRKPVIGEKIVRRRWREAGGLGGPDRQLTLQKQLSYLSANVGGSSYCRRLPCKAPDQFGNNTHPIPPSVRLCVRDHAKKGAVKPNNKKPQPLGVAVFIWSHLPDSNG